MKKANGSVPVLGPVSIRQFPQRALLRLGRVVKMGERLTPDELMALGFDQAAIGVRTGFQYHYRFEWED